MQAMLGWEGSSFEGLRGVRRRALLLDAVRERGPRLGVAAADVARDDLAVLVEDGDGRVAVELERAGEGDVGVGERRPRPAVLLEERPRRAGVVADVDADELVLRVAVGELGVGDRLAVADRSPRGPDVHVDDRAAKVGEREAPAGERLAFELHARGGRGRRGRRLVGGGLPAARGECEDHACEEAEAKHRRHRSPEAFRAHELSAGRLASAGSRV
jgi:hypothetical protein